MIPKLLTKSACFSACWIWIDSNMARVAQNWTRGTFWWSTRHISWANRNWHYPFTSETSRIQNSSEITWPKSYGGCFSYLTEGALSKVMSRHRANQIMTALHLDSSSKIIDSARIMNAVIKCFNEFTKAVSLTESSRTSTSFKAYTADRKITDFSLEPRNWRGDDISCVYWPLICFLRHFSRSKEVFCLTFKRFRSFCIWRDRIGYFKYVAIVRFYASI